MTTASSNVVPLPTAAKQKVRQRSVKAVREYKTANPWPGHHEFESMQARRTEAEHFCRTEAERLASIFLGIEETPAVRIVHAMLATMTDEQRAAIVNQITSASSPERKATAEAMVLIRTAKMTRAEHREMLEAIDRLKGKGE